jgi:molybdate transport system substrate-binding protein
MPTRLFTGLAIVLAAALLVSSTPARAELNVMISGGFALAYRELLPKFERTTGIKVVTGSGASQGTSPQTIKAQLERGARPDVVILSGEGLEELIAAGRIVSGTEVGLARSPLGAAVRSGSPRPDFSTVDALRQSLLKARLIVMPGSTSGIYIRENVLPKLGIADKVSKKVVPRSTEATSMVASGEADIALAPVSELVNLPGVEFVSPLPNDVQLVQEFTAAIVNGSNQVEDAKRLIAFLSSSQAAAAIRKIGMEPAGNHKAH